MTLLNLNIHSQLPWTYKVYGQRVGFCSCWRENDKTNYQQVTTLVLFNWLGKIIEICPKLGTPDVGSKRRHCSAIEMKNQVIKTFPSLLKFNFNVAWGKFKTCFKAFFWKYSCYRSSKVTWLSVPGWMTVLICLFLRLNITISVLSVFKMILLALNHWTIRERSCS